MPKKKGKRMDKLLGLKDPLELQQQQIHEKKVKKSGKRSEDSDYGSDNSKKSPMRKGEDLNAIVEVKDDKGKKQHKIRRKLLMGGLIRRKNRSMPDLREGQEEEKKKAVDDLEVRCHNTKVPSSLGGYLSEGDFANPNLERSKLMRKSFHGSISKGALKVPPPIPQRTTSQLTQQEPPPRPNHNVPPPIYANGQDMIKPPPILPPKCQMTPEVIKRLSPQPPIEPKPPTPTQITVQAVVHQEQKENSLSLMQHSRNAKENSSLVQHSRDGSEEFPPPPPPLEEAVEDLKNRGLLPSEPTSKTISSPATAPTTLLSQLQKKCEQMKENGQNKLSIDDRVKSSPVRPKTASSSWLEELQAKQASLKQSKEEQTSSEIVQKLAAKVEDSLNIEGGVDEVDCKVATSKVGSLNKELFTREYTQCNSLTFPSQSGHESRMGASSAFRNRTSNDPAEPTQTSTTCKKVDLDVSSENNAAVKKKKCVTFCDQVVLVATAEDEEEDAYIPNPILERVLKSALTQSTPTPTDVPDGPRKSIQQRISTPQASPQSPIQSTAPISISATVSTTSTTSLKPTQKIAPAPQLRLPPPYQPPPSVVKQHQPQQPNATLPNGLPPSQMPHLIPNLSQKPTRPSVYHSIPSNHYHPQNHYKTPPNTSTNIPQANHLNNSSQPHYHPQQSHAPSHINNHNSTNSNPPTPSVNHHHRPPITSQQPSPMTHQHNQSYPTTTAHQHSPYQPVPHPQRPPQPHQHTHHHHPRSAIPKGAPPLTHQHNGLEPNQQKSYPPYQRVPHRGVPPNHVNGYSSLPPDRNTHNNRNTPTHFAGPLDPSAIYTTVNKSAKTPKPALNNSNKNNNGNNNNKINNKNTSNNSGGALQPCNLCRKKVVNPPSVYCSDCNFYLSRFKPKT